MNTEEWLAAFDKRNAENKPRLVDLNGLPEPVYMRKQMVGDMDANMRYDKRHAEDADYEPTVYAFCKRLCTADGMPIFDADNPEHRRRVSQMIGDDILKMRDALGAADGEVTAEGN